MGRRTIVLFVALILAAVSAFAVWRYLSTVEDNVRRDIAEVVVWRTTQPIETGTEGQLIIDNAWFVESSELVEFVAFEGSDIFCGGPVLKDGLDPAEQPGCHPDNPVDITQYLSDKVAAGPISQNQVISAAMFVRPSELNDIKFSESLEQGKVAISFRPDEADAVGGLIRPGDKINVIASAEIQINSFTSLLADPELRQTLFESGIGTDLADVLNQNPDTGTAETAQAEEDALARFASTLPGQIQFTQTVLQEVRVVAVGALVEDGEIGGGLEPQGSQIVVVEVTPQQAEQIAYLKLFTNVDLALLPFDEPYAPFESTGITVDDLFTLLQRLEAQVEGTFGQ
jgi:Flp pilus assembly protein CpaB